MVKSIQTPHVPSFSSQKATKPPALENCTPTRLLRGQPCFWVIRCNWNYSRLILVWCSLLVLHSSKIFFVMKREVVYHRCSWHPLFSPTYDLNILCIVFIFFFMKKMPHIVIGMFHKVSWLPRKYSSLARTSPSSPRTAMRGAHCQHTVCIL
jgi:hypothetical protein